MNAKLVANTSPLTIPTAAPKHRFAHAWRIATVTHADSADTKRSDHRLTPKALNVIVMSQTFSGGFVL